MSEYDKTPSFKLTELDSPITSHAVVVAVDDGTMIRADGTGLFIARQLVVTAAHVIQHFWNVIEQRPIPSGEVACQFGIHILQFPGECAVPALWAVRRVWVSPITDIAFMHVVPVSKEAEEFAWSGSLQIEPLPPSVGDRVVGFGYPSSSARVTSRSPIQHVDWDLRPHTTVGEIETVFEDRRDRTLLHFPCFQTNARFDGGMSGGPILNSTGQLCGIISAALQTDEQGPYTSYGAMIWPALFTTVDFKVLDLNARVHMVSLNYPM
ncbi:MAG TPA: serine protease [Blastocatellia bacterium]|jgi:S1-C subfamily serine protease|nr:serine protease [Blastocatellia bacterium]